MKKILTLLIAAFIISLFSGFAALAATEYPYGQGGTLAPSAIGKTSARKKVESKALIVKPTVQTPSGQTVWYGIRNTGDVRVHKAAVSKTSKVTSFGVAYDTDKGYGIVNESYKLAVQNDSASTKSVTVDGTFIP